MELKDVMEFVIEHAVEGVVFIFVFGILVSLFFGGGLEHMISLMGMGMFGGS